MNTVTKTLSWIALACAAWGTAVAQQQPAVPPATPQSEAGEPRADTSSPAASEPAPPAAATTSAGPSAGHSTSGSTGRTAVARTPPTGRGGAPAAPAKTDRLDLGTATVTGDREQPKVMYIVPWKKSDIGDLAGKPMNSLVDEILSPVDRDVFKREVVYYHAVQADASQNGASPKPAQQGEK